MINESKFKEIYECWFCLTKDPCDVALNDILLYNQPFAQNDFPTIRHTEYSEYIMEDKLIKIKFDNIYMSEPECVIITIDFSTFCRNKSN